VNIYPIVRIRGLFAGVKFLHSSGIIHKDLSARHILVKQEHGRICSKIAGFSLSFEKSQYIPGTIQIGFKI
jgi:hypothetical protein